MIISCAGYGTGINGIDGFSGSGTPGSTTPNGGGGTTTQDAPGSRRIGGAPNTGGGLSEGAKGGIAGGVIGAAILFLVLLFLVLRGRQAAKNSTPVVIGTDTVEKRDTTEPAKLGEHRDMESQKAPWGELGGREIPAGPGSSARGAGSIVELGPNPPRPRGTLPGEQSLGYSSVVTELESPPAATELEGAGASSVSPVSAGPRSVVGSGAQELATPRGGEDLDRLLRLDEELEERRRTLEEIKVVQAQQAALREQMRQMQAP